LCVVLNPIFYKNLYMRILGRFKIQRHSPCISQNLRRLIIKGTNNSFILPLKNFSVINNNKIFLSNDQLNYFSDSLNKCSTLYKFGTFSKVKAEGVGLKFKRYTRSSKLISLKLGYSHTIYYQFPNRVSIRVGKHRIAMFSHSLSLLSEVSSSIRGYRPPDPYKGRGLRYDDERLKLKPGKQRLR
jgi:hypothetical protein